MPVRKGTRAAAGAKSPDAITLLKTDHKKVRGLLEALEKTQNANRREALSSQIEQELKIHTQIEEEIFYPAFKEAAKKKDDRVLFWEAKEEHHVVDHVLPEVRETAPQGEQYEAMAKVLKDVVLHHATEEEKEMFPRAKKLLSKDELRELGARMQQRKSELQENPRKLNS